MWPGNEATPVWPGDEATPVWPGNEATPVLPGNEATPVWPWATPGYSTTGACQSTGLVGLIARPLPADFSAMEQSRDSSPWVQG